MNTNIKLIDTHAHIYSDELSENIDDIILRINEAGISDVFMPNIDSTTISAMLDLELKNNNFHAMMGLHPCYVKDEYKKELKIVDSWFEKRNFCAVGEIGIDLYWDKTHYKEQIQAFEYQISIAKNAKVPFVIHSRDSLDITIETVKKKQKGDLCGIFHCFNGTMDQANQIIDLGFYLGIGGVITYKNSGMDKVLENIPIKNIVLETDSPYLAPVPKRGKKNEPSYLTYICQKLSEIQSKSYEQVAEATSLNAKILFGSTPK